MDKETIEKMGEILVKVYGMALHSEGKQVVRTDTLAWAREELHKFYHKPKGKPPLLSDEEKDKIINLATKLTNPMPLIEVMRFADAVAQAQREADIKWYEANQSNK